MQDVDAIRGYHAHVYWNNQEDRDRAAEVREALGARFNVTLGRWHDKLVGPHRCYSYQVAFSSEEFPRIVPWLMLNRRGLVILLHPITDDAYTDHRDNSIWFGERLELDLSVLPKKYTANQASEIPGTG